MANWFDEATGEVANAANAVDNFLDRFNMNLPHFKHSRAAIYNWEPVFLNQFDAVITPPASVVKEDGYADLLVEQIKSVDGMPEILPTSFVEQNYMWAKRTFSKPTPDQVTAEFSITFEINLNSRNSMYAYETLRAWAEKQFEPTFGLHGLKGDYAGEITILLNNKRRRTIRQWSFKQVYMIEPLTAMTLDYLSEEIYVLTANFKSDMWSDKRIKPKTNTLS